MDAEVYPQEVLADEEPKYLRRQKPLEIKRRKFGRKAWMTYLHVGLWILGVSAAAGTAYFVSNFLLHSRAMALIHPEQIHVTGNRNVQSATVLGIFAADRNHSVLRIPLAERKRQIESLPWVERGTVRRVLPNHLEIEIVERTPIAFLRDDGDMNLVDTYGMILERPLKGEFHFPVVSGIDAGTPIDEREKRMELYAGFIQQIRSVNGDATEQVSEVDLSDAEDLRATLTGLPGGSSAGDTASGDWGQTESPLLVHFGDSDFEAKYRRLIENIGQWRATVGRVESVDLRFSREAVVNPEGVSVPLKNASTKNAIAKSTAQGLIDTPAPARHSAAHKASKRLEKRAVRPQSKAHATKKSV